MRLIDADALMVDFLRYVRTPPHLHYGGWDKMCISGAEIDEVVANAPTIDAEPVVRCRDCKEYELDCGYCDYWETDRRVDDFCSRGAKMDGGASDENA